MKKVTHRREDNKHHRGTSVSESIALARIKQDMQELIDEPSELYQAWPINKNNLFDWEAMILGPDDTLYEDR